MMETKRLTKQRLKQKSVKLKQNYKRTGKDQFLISNCLSQQIILFIFYYYLCYYLYHTLPNDLVLRTVPYRSNKKYLFSSLTHESNMCDFYAD